MNELHQIYLEQALLQAQIRRGFCSPNPSVGAIVVKKGQVLATGYHQASGQPHAEVAALQKLGEEAKGATLYITLEPCCHHGKTPPCTDLIISRGIEEVYYAFQDPNPQVVGKGEKQLSAAGVRCTQLPSATIDNFYQSYAYWTQTRLPWVTAKLAMSLDGKIAGFRGKPAKISGSRLDEFTHQQRKCADAILTSARTVNQDDPQLNARMQDEIVSKPVYVLDTHLSLNPNAQLFATAQKLTIFYDETKDNLAKRKQFQHLGVNCIAITSSNNRLDLNQVMQHIGSAGAHDLWVEAGGLVFENLVKAEQVNRCFIYVAAKTLGWQAHSAFHLAGDLFSSAKSVQWQSWDSDAVCEMNFPECARRESN